MSAPASMFSGDLLLAAYSPNGTQHILIGDFTGHGLAAALGAMPVADVFHSMTEKGFGLGQIVTEIDRKLRILMPTGRFFAACLLAVDPGHATVSLWNGGMPDVLVHGAGLRRVSSNHLPLGIDSGEDLGIELQTLDLHPMDRIYVCSDGLIEAEAPDGDMFGSERLEGLFAERTDAGPFEAIVSALQSFRGDAPSRDDISLVEITFEPALFPKPEQRKAQDCHTEPLDWSIVLSLGPLTLRQIDPVPLLVSQISELQPGCKQKEDIYLILRELYSNALDHGILGLDSKMRQTAEGFQRYYELRAERLEKLQTGSLEIQLRNEPLHDGGQLRLTILDSGQGFDHEGYLGQLAENSGFCGRGIALTKSLCVSLGYSGPGNCVEAVYRW